jgi:large subunit ribosomal protein L29
MHITKIRELSDEQLLAELTTARRHLYDLRFQLATRQLTDFNQIADTRKSIARLLTVQTERGVVATQVAPKRTRRTKPAVAGGSR